MTHQTLRAWRETHQWTDGQAAEYLGVNVATYRNWEAGRRAPPDSIARLIYVLGMVESLAPEIHAHLLPGEPARVRPGRKPRNGGPPT